MLCDVKKLYFFYRRHKKTLEERKQSGELFSDDRRSFVDLRTSGSEVSKCYKTSDRNKLALRWAGLRRKKKAAKYVKLCRKFLQIKRICKTT